MKQEFFKENRRRLGRQLEGGLVVLTAHEEMQRTHDMAFPFAQEPNFWYLTGIDAPRWKLVYDALRDHSWLVSPDISEVERIFKGSLDDAQALLLSGADEVIQADDFVPLLRQLTRSHPLVHSVFPLEKKRLGDIVQNPALGGLKSQLDRTFSQTKDCLGELSKLRAIKQQTEIAQMQRAIRLTCEAFSKIKKTLADYRHEYEVQAVFDYEFVSHSMRHAYDPIVAGGKNACQLHYVDNNDAISKRLPVLIDIGASIGGYAADITRTYAPGQTTKRQRDVHGCLAGAQKQIIDLIRPGVSLETYVAQAEEIMASSLASLGLRASSSRELVYRYMPHAVSHGLGLDVHESLGGFSTFQPGMVLTVEPGIYLPEEGFGMRIEDDILVTDHGHKNLSQALSTDL